MSSQSELRAWETLQRQSMMDLSPWLHLWKEVVRLPDGRVIDDFYTLDMPDFVVVTAVNHEGAVVVGRQYRHGPRRVVLALPAGYIEPGESALDGAKRELLEETGYGGGIWDELGAFVVDGNRGCGQAHIFLALDVERVADPTDGDLEERQIVLLSPAEFLNAISCGEVVGLASLGAFMLANARLHQGDVNMRGEENTFPSRGFPHCTVQQGG